MIAAFPGIAPNIVEWRRIDNVSASPRSPTTGTQQVIARPGGAWACSMTWENMRDKYRHELMSWQSQLRGGAAHTWLSPYDRSKTGMPVTSPLQNYAEGISWAGTSSDPLPHNFSINNSPSAAGVDSKRIVKGSNHYSNQVSPGFSLNSFTQFRADVSTKVNIVFHYDGESYSVDGSEITLSSFATASSTAGVAQGRLDTNIQDGPQRRIIQINKALSDLVALRLSITSTNSTVHNQLSMYDLAAIDPIVVNYNLPNNVKNIPIAGFPASAIGQKVYIEGDYVEIDSQLFRLTSDAVCQPDGATMVNVLPRTRRALTAGAVVNHYRPSVKMRLLENEYGHASRPYGIANALSSFTMNFIEVIE